jgi:hypothetical protein
VRKALRLTKENGADTAFVHVALLSGAIKLSEFIGWTERVIMQADNLLPDYIYEVASLNKNTATLSELRTILPNVNGDVSREEDKVLMAISVLRDPEIIERSDEPRPKNSKAAQKTLTKYTHATSRFDDFFPGIIA